MVCRGVKGSDIVQILFVTQGFQLELVCRKRITMVFERKRFATHGKEPEKMCREQERTNVAR